MENAKSTLIKRNETFSLSFQRFAYPIIVLFIFTFKIYPLNEKGNGWESHFLKRVTDPLSVQWMLIWNGDAKDWSSWWSHITIPTWEIMTHKKQKLTLKNGLSLQNYVAYMKETDWSSGNTNGMRQWTYQTCTEFGYFQTSDSKSQVQYIFLIKN